MCFHSIELLFFVAVVAVMSLIRYTHRMYYIYAHNTQNIVQQYWRDTRIEEKKEVESVRKIKSESERAAAIERERRTKSLARLLSVKFYCAFISYTCECNIIASVCVVLALYSCFHFYGINAFNITTTLCVYFSLFVIHVNGWLRNCIHAKFSFIKSDSKKYTHTSLPTHNRHFLRMWVCVCVSQHQQVNLFWRLINFVHSW